MSFYMIISYDATIVLSLKPNSGLCSCFKFRIPITKYYINRYFTYTFISSRCQCWFAASCCKSGCSRLLFMYKWRCRSWITKEFYLSLLKVVVKRSSFRSYNKMTIVRIKQFYPDDGHFIIWPKDLSFYNNF